MADNKRPAFRLTLRDTNDNTYQDVGAAWPSQIDGVYNVRLGNTSDSGACEVEIIIRPKGGKAFKPKFEKGSGFFLNLSVNSPKKGKRQEEPEADPDLDLEEDF